MNWFLYGRDLRHETVKPTRVLSIRETKRQWSIFEVELTVSDKYWHSINRFYCKTYIRGVFRNQSNIYN